MQDVLKKIKPSDQERKRAAKVVGSFLKALNKDLHDAEAILAGSGAKETWLKSSYDVDIFVTHHLFPTSKIQRQMIPAGDFLIFFCTAGAKSGHLAPGVPTKGW